MTDPTRTGEGVRYGLWTLGAVVLGLAGYVGYVLYPRFDLPAGAGAGLLILAAAAGVASFFSPCSFPLLVTMLARPLASAGDAGERPLRRALAYATALSIGAAAFLTLAGGAIALGAGALVEDVTFTSTTGSVLRITVGAALILFGLVQLNRMKINLRRFESALHGVLRNQAALRRRRPLAGFVLFGFVYLLAGFG
jgi:cytochrome c biogenesis protein CcdA